MICIVSIHRGRTTSADESETPMASLNCAAAPSFVYACEIDLARTYALRSPGLAKECAQTALDAALTMKRPDLAFAANTLLAAIANGGKS